MNELKTHPIAELNGSVTESEIERIAASIEKVGQRYPILQLEDGRIVDGRIRALACKRLGILPKIQVIPDVGENGDKAPPPFNKLLAIVHGADGARRNLSAPQLAIKAARAWKLYAEANGIERGGDQKSEEAKSKVQNGLLQTFEEFAKSMGAGERYAKQAQSVINAEINGFDGDGVLAKSMNLGDLKGAYEEFQAAKKAAKAKKEESALIAKFPEIAGMLKEGRIDHGQAYTYAQSLDAKDRAEREDKTAQGRDAVERINAAARLDGISAPLSLAIEYKVATREKIIETVSAAVDALSNLKKTL